MNLPKPPEKSGELSDSSRLPAYRQALSRRSILKGTLGAGLVAAVPGLACGSGDADVFAGTDRASEAAAQAGEPTPVPTTAPLTTGESASAEAQVAPTESAAAETEPTEAQVAPTESAAAETEPTQAQAGPTESAAAETEPTQAQAGPTEPPALPVLALATGSTMDISFTYEMSPGGKQLAPYVAVWLEDAESTLVETIALWYQQDRKGPRWLPDLKRWYTRDQDRIGAGGGDMTDQISSATRLPGTYNLVWDGTVAGQMAAAGNYFVCIESARERGPYSLIRQPVELVGAPVSMALPADGELVAASITVA